MLPNDVLQHSMKPLQIIIDAKFNRFWTYSIERAIEHALKLFDSSSPTEFENPLDDMNDEFMNDWDQPEVYVGEEHGKGVIRILNRNFIRSKEQVEKTIRDTYNQVFKFSFLSSHLCQHPSADGRVSHRGVCQRFDQMGEPE